jgi:hypothetical protein
MKIDDVDVVCQPSDGQDGICEGSYHNYVFWLWMEESVNARMTYVGFKARTCGEKVACVLAGGLAGSDVTFLSSPSSHHLLCTRSNLPVA